MKIGEYTLTHRLGAGGMGTVFRAVDAFNKPAALKIIGSQAVIDATIHAGGMVPHFPALDLGCRMMFVREARLAMELNHPNIARVFDYGQHQGLLFIVMEFLAGRSLDKVIPLRAAVPLSTQISLIRQLCEALDYAHSQNVIHRYVKPANYFVLQNMELKVLDFGIASRPEFTQGEGPRVGTPHYMAPEVCSSPPQYTKNVDIWAAGVTLYQFLTGSLPFTGNSMGQLIRNIVTFPPLAERFPHSGEVGRILERALAKNPAMRYASAADFAHDLSSLERLMEEPGALAPSGATYASESHWWAAAVVRETDQTSPLPKRRARQFQ